MGSRRAELRRGWSRQFGETRCPQGSVLPPQSLTLSLEVLVLLGDLTQLALKLSPSQLRVLDLVLQGLQVLLLPPPRPPGGLSVRQHPPHPPDLALVLKAFGGVTNPAAATA